MHITDKLKTVPAATLELLAARDPDASAEIFRRRLGESCWRHLRMVASLKRYQVLLQQPGDIIGGLPRSVVETEVRVLKEILK